VVFKEKFCKVACSFEEEAGSAGEQTASNKMNGATEYSHSKDFMKVESLFFILEFLNGSKNLIQ